MFRSVATQLDATNCWKRKQLCDPGPKHTALLQRGLAGSPTWLQIIINALANNEVLDLAKKNAVKKGKL